MKWGNITVCLFATSVLAHGLAEAADDRPCCPIGPFYCGQGVPACPITPITRPTTPPPPFMRRAEVPALSQVEGIENYLIYRDSKDRVIFQREVDRNDWLREQKRNFNFSKGHLYEIDSSYREMLGLPADTSQVYIYAK